MNSLLRLLIITSIIAFSHFALSAQNVGIGTSTPQGEFHVSKENSITGPIFYGSGLDDLVVTFDPSVEITSYTEFTIVVDNTGPEPNLIDIYVFDNLLHDNIPMAHSGIELIPGTSIGFTSLTGHTWSDGWIIKLFPGNPDQLLVQGDKVGIGTSTPNYKLDVNGDINFAGDIYQGGNVYAPTMWIDNLMDANTTNNNLSLGMNAGANSTGTQNVFLGVDAGASLTTGNNNLIIGYGAAPLKPVGSGNIYLGNEVLAPTNENNTLRINNDDSDIPLIYGNFYNGFVGINRTYHVSSAEIFGIGKKDVYSGEYVGMYVKTEGAASSRPFYGFAIDNKHSWIEFNGGTNDIEVYNSYGDLSVIANTATKPVSGSWASNSDQRLKKNIKFLDSNEMLEKVKLMQGVNYEWNDDKTEFKRPEGEQIGFIAQDLQQIWPEKVSTDSQGYLVTAYGDYDPVIIEAIKALAEKIDAQEKQIAELADKLSEMEHRSKD